MSNQIEFTRINNDTNGNPRYVCHFYNLLKSSDLDWKEDNKDKITINWIDWSYQTALKNSRSLGGRKFHNKQYGGGIVFQSYNISELEKQILAL